MLKRKKYKVFPVLLSNKGNNTEHVWLSGPLELNDNDDVLITDPEDGQILVYDEENNVWVNDFGGSGSESFVSEIHTWGESKGSGDFVVGKEYFGGSLTTAPGGAPTYPIWNEGHWNYEVDPQSWSPQTESGVGRKVPRGGVSGVVVSGHVGVPEGTSCKITVYWTRCFMTGVEYTLPPQQLSCLGGYDTGIQSNGVAGAVHMTCFEFSVYTDPLVLTSDNLIIITVTCDGGPYVAGQTIKGNNVVNILNLTTSLIYSEQDDIPPEGGPCIPTGGGGPPEA